MAAQLLEVEGTWEEIAARAPEFAGRRVRLTVLPAGDGGDIGDGDAEPDPQETLQLLDEWENTPLSEEETAILDGFEQFRAEHPFRLRQLQDEE